MGLFRKKGDEIIDFSEMYKRGMIKASADKNEPDVLDFTSKPTNASTNSSVSNDNFDFLGGLAGAGGGSVTENLRAARVSHNDRNEVNELRIKLEDTEYKLNNLINKVQELESKLREFRI